MPALVFPATGFTTSTQFTSTFATFSITVPGKVASRAKLKSTDSRSFGKVLPRSNIRGTVDRRQTFGKVLPRSNIRGLPVYITPPKITTFKVPSNKISSIETNYSNVSKLSPFVNQGLTSGLAYPVSGQDAISNNSINYVINDLDVLVISTTASGSSQTLYFNPDKIFDPSKLTFTIGDYVKITNNNDFTAVVEVTTSTVNSITFDLVTNLPVNKLGGLSIQLASNDLFPTTSVLANYYANLSTTGIRITPTNPRENLAVSQMELPVLRYRAQQYYLDTRELSDTLPLLSSTTNSLSVFDDATIPGDFRLNVIGQTSETIYNTVLNYVNDLDILTYTTATVNVKTVYFSQQDAIPFPNESTVRIINSTVGYKQEFNVIDGTSNSVSFINPGNLPTEGLTIEKTVASVYPQSFVTTQVAPTSARENLYYFNISPGLRAGQQHFIASADISLLNGNLGKQLLILKTPTTLSSITNTLSVFDDDSIPGDFRLTITGQTDQKIYNTVLTYVNDLDILTYTTATVTVKTIYFLQQDATPFPSGSIVRIINANTGYKQVFTVIDGTSNSVSFTNPSNLPVSGTIEKSVASVYPQSFVTTQVAPTNPRENLYYFNISPGLRAAQQYFISSGDVSLLNGNLGKQLSILKTSTTPLNTGKLSSAAQLKADSIILKVNKLSSAAKLTTTGFTQPILFVSTITNFFSQSAVSTKIAPTNARENFYYFNLAPGKRSNSSIVQGVLFVEGVLPTNLGLIKQPQSNFVDIGTKLIKSGQVQKPISKLVYDTAIFNAGALKSVSILKGADGVFNNERLNDYIFLRPVNGIFNYEQLDVFKIRSDQVQFFETPILSKLTDVTSLRPDRSLFTSGQIQKPISKLVYDTAKFNTGNLKSVSTLKADSLKFNYEQLDVFKIRSNTTRMFETPRIGNIRPFSYNFTTFNDLALNTGNLKSTSKLVGADGVFNNERLNDYIFLRPVNGIFNYEQLDVFKIRSNTVQFFETPTSSKLVSVASLKSDRNIFTIDKLSATAIVRADKSRLTTDNLKSSAVLKEYGDSRQLYRPDSFDNYIDQTTVRPTTAPTNPSERFYYFNLAPGYRRNSSIQDGKVFEPPNSIIKNDRLELFDNIGYQLNISNIYDVSGQTTGVTSNTVLYYLDDLDILTTTTTPIDSVTIFFENSQRLPFSIGDTVYVTKNQDSEIMPIRGFIFTVLESTFNSITIAKPTDWDTTWTFSTIRLTGAEYYPRAKVRTTVAPTNAREALFYSEMAPGIRTNRTISYGNTFDDIVRIKSPDASIFKYISGKEIPGASGFFDASIKPLVITTLTKDIFKLRELSRITTVSLLTKDILKLRALAVDDSKGLIVKLIAGDGRRGATGFIDSGAIKKEPIQFWN